MTSLLPDIDPKLQFITVDDVPENLKGHVVQFDDGLFTWFHHPHLILTLPSALPATLEEILADRREQVERALLADEWGDYVFAHERPYRFGALWKIAEIYGLESEETTKRDAARFWKLAAEVWVDAETDEADEVWTDTMNMYVPHRAAMTDGPDRRRLRDLAAPDGLVTVYRGVQARTAEEAEDATVEGWSWSLSRDVAAWFAWRWLSAERKKAAPGGGFIKPWVAVARVPVDKVAALITRRGEEEILIDPLETDALTLTIEPAGPRPSKSSI